MPHDTNDDNISNSLNVNVFGKRTGISRKNFIPSVPHKTKLEQFSVSKFIFKLYSLLSF